MRRDYLFALAVVLLFDCVSSFSFTNLLYRIHICHHETPGPLGCGPPICHESSTLPQCKDSSYSGHSGGGSSGGSGGGSGGSGSSGGSSSSISSSSGGSGGSNSVSASNGSSSSSVSGGSGTNGVRSGGGGGTETTTSTVLSAVSDWMSKRNVLLVLIPALLVSAAIAGVAIASRRSTSPSHPLRGALNRRMKLFGRLAPMPKKQSVETPYQQTEQDGTVQV